MLVHCKSRDFIVSTADVAGLSPLLNKKKFFQWWQPWLLAINSTSLRGSMRGKAVVRYTTNSTWKISHTNYTREKYNTNHITQKYNTKSITWKYNTKSITLKYNTKNIAQKYNIENITPNYNTEKQHIMFNFNFNNTHKTQKRLYHTGNRTYPTKCIKREKYNTWKIQYLKIQHIHFFSFVFLFSYVFTLLFPLINWFLSFAICSLYLNYVMGQNQYFFFIY